MIDRWLEETIGNVIPASSGSELRVDCPFCEGRVGKPDNNHHMYVSQVKPVAFCFRCGWQGSHVSMVMAVEECGYGEALLRLDNPTPTVEKFGRQPLTGMLTAVRNVMSQPEGFRLIDCPPVGCPLEERAVWRYLHVRRGIAEAIIRRYMGWVPGTNRAWILVDQNWWQGRLIIPGQPKYLSPPWPKGDALWNGGALNRYRDIIIAEGVFSAMSAGQNAIALCGKTITEPQAMRIIRARPDRITVMLDADALNAAYDLASALVGYGYKGRLTIHQLAQGDPTDGLEGTTIPYGWATEARRRISAAV